MKHLLVLPSLPLWCQTEDIRLSGSVKQMDWEYYRRLDSFGHDLLIKLMDISLLNFQYSTRFICDPAPFSKDPPTHVKTACLSLGLLIPLHNYLTKQHNISNQTICIILSENRVISNEAINEHTKNKNKQKINI